MIATIKCQKKTLILGNHCTERVHITELVKSYDVIHGLWTKRNCWWSHCPLHPHAMRGHILNIHGHEHGNLVMTEEYSEHSGQPFDTPDPMYFNACLEQTDYQPICFEDIMKIKGLKKC